MKIIIVCNSFYPDISPRSFRATELLKELCRQGHELTLICPEKSEISQIQADYNFTYKSLGKLDWKVPVKSKGIIGLFKRGLNRALHLLLEYPGIELYFKVKKLLRKWKDPADLLISIAVPYPIHWGVAAARNDRNPIAKVWVADCGDPYMGQENDTFKRPFYFAGVEKWFMRKANYISIPTSEAINGYYKEFHHKMKIIPQGLKFEDIELSDHEYSDGKIHFAYAGMFIPGKRDPAEFLKYLSSLGEEYNFVFHIYTKTPQWVTPHINSITNKIKLHPILPRKEVLFELSKMQFLVNFENVGTTQTPSKLIDYAILNKPILSIRTGNLESENIKSFLQSDFTNSFKVLNRDQYRIENVANQFTRLTLNVGV